MGEGHQHARTERFDFPEPRDTKVFTCQHVQDGVPILHVRHDADGEWQFLCGGEHEEVAVVACLACMVAGHPTLGELVALACNCSAERDGAATAWRRPDNLEDE